MNLRTVGAVLLALGLGVLVGSEVIGRRWRGRYKRLQDMHVRSFTVSALRSSSEPPDA